MAKMEFIHFGFRQMLSLCNVEEIDVQGTKISRSKLVRYLAALLDSGTKPQEACYNNLCKGNEQYQ